MAFTSPLPTPRMLRLATRRTAASADCLKATGFPLTFFLKPSLSLPWSAPQSQSQWNFLQIFFRNIISIIIVINTIRIIVNIIIISTFIQKKLFRRVPGSATSATVAFSTHCRVTLRRNDLFFSFLYLKNMLFIALEQ